MSPGSRTMLGDFLMEMVSTFAFAMVAGLSYGESILVTAIAIGLGCAVLVSSERAHMNPVITIAIVLCETENYSKCAMLVIRLLAQFIGCLLGGLTAVDGLRDDVMSFSERSGQSTAKCFVFEIIFSLILVLVVLRTKETYTGAFAHGFCYSIAILCGYLLFEGNALVNPIIALGLLVGSSSFDDGQTDESQIWLYFVGPFIGCLLAVLFYWLTEYLHGNLDESEDEYTDDTTEYVTGTEYRKAHAQPVDEDETTEYVRGVQYQQVPKQPSGGPQYRPRYQQTDANYPQPRGQTVVDYKQPSGENYQQPIANFQQPPSGNYQPRSHVAATNYQPSRNQQPATVNNQQSMLRQRRVASSQANSQPNASGYPQQPAYGQGRQPTVTASRYVQ